MNRYGVVGAGVAVVSLGGFALAQALHVPWTGASSPVPTAEPGVALIGVALLLGDAVLPVPSSLVMLGLGAAFGTAGGTVLALIGRVGGTLLGFAIGRRLAGSEPPPGSARAARLLRRWGAVALAVSRPVPVVSESVAVLAGMSALGWRRATAATVAGSLPEAALLCWAGAQARDAGTWSLIWIGILLTATAVWAVERRRSADVPPPRGAGQAVLGPRLRERR
ncbi:TVP38/TMEM64 family protein [Geodermatophilus sp. SYSU D00691]